MAILLGDTVVVANIIVVKINVDTCIMKMLF